MRRIVVSSPRSGLNWLRFSVEHFLGLRTPGKPVLISEQEQPEPAFLRSHDPLWKTKRPWLLKRDFGEAYLKIDPAGTADDIVVLLLRDFREIFVRSCRKRYRKYRHYTGNLAFYETAASRRKAVFYYEDLVADPGAMAGLMNFLELGDLTGGEITAERLAAGWEAAAAKSRDSYDRNQAASGGAQTRSEPLNFGFHQAKLSDRERARLEAYTKAELPAAALAHLDRYF